MTESHMGRHQGWGSAYPPVEARYVIKILFGDQRFQVEGDNWGAVTTDLTAFVFGQLGEQLKITGEVPFIFTLKEGDREIRSGSFCVKPTSRSPKATVRMAVETILPSDRNLGEPHFDLNFEIKKGE